MNLSLSGLWTDISPPDITPTRVLTTNRAFRIASVVAAVLLWMWAGWHFRLDADRYLLSGVPMTLLYQRFVRRRPLLALWQFDAQPIIWSAKSLAFTGIAASVPLWSLYRGELRSRPIETVVFAWLSCAVVGSVGLGVGLANWRRLGWNNAVLYKLMAAATVAGLFTIALSGSTAEFHLPHAASQVAVRFTLDVVLYAAVGFVLEEVAFRGLVDRVLVEALPSRPFVSAAIGALLWGVWHWPLYVEGTNDVAIAIRILLFHVGLGIPLAFVARQAGALCPAALTHALVDAGRNALLG